MPRARAADAFVVWIISIVAAGVFLLAGIPKIIGMPTVALQAAAMNEFPAWIRVVVGVVEVVGAIGLLIPATATFAALALAFLMVPATLTQYASHQPGMWVPLVLIAALLLVAWRRNAITVYQNVHQFTDHPHPLLHDGIIAGLIGAMCIALWFFVIDLIAGEPFLTPRTLGRGLIAVLGPGAEQDGATAAVLVYTVFHFAAFMVVGLVAALIVFLARQEPSILIGFVVLFAAIEVGFYGFTSLLHEASGLGNLAWYQVMLGNVIAAAAMGTYFWRTHRELGDEFRHSLDWDTEALSPDRRAASVKAPAAVSPVNDGRPSPAPKV